MTSILSSFLQYISQYLIYIILGILVLAIVLMIFVVFTTSRAMKKARRAPAKAPKPAAKPAPPEDKMPPIGGRVSESLSLKGYFRIGDISVSFLKSLDYLRSALGGRNYKYHLPWFLLLGPTGSGKTTLLESAELSLPVGRPDFALEDPHPHCDWWYFNHGIVLDVRGDLFIKESGSEADEKGWRALLHLLGRYRAKRPIDGILLAIPATQLYGKEGLSVADIQGLANQLSQKLHATQLSLGLKLPVYIVVTKCDVVPGFQSFCSEIPASNRANMLGWSVPYALSIGFTPQWIEEAFASLQHSLNQLRLEIYAEGKVNENQDGVFVFPAEIMKLQAKLTPYLTQLFKKSAYEESLFFRGLYFCGDSGLNVPPFIPGNFLEPEDSEEEEDPLEPTFAPPKTDALAPLDRKVFFVTDLIQDKIFAEGGLAQPIHARLLTANRNLNLAKISLSTFIVLATVGVLKAYEQFSQNRDYLVPLLGKMSQVLRQVQQERGQGTHTQNEQFGGYAKELTAMMLQMQQTSFFSIFFPPSWFSPLDNKLQASLGGSYEQILIQTIRMDLMIKTRELLALRPTAKQKSTSLEQLLQPLTMPEYLLFQSFVQRYAELKRYVDKYNQLKDATDSTLLSELIVFSLNTTLPKEFESNYHYFRRLFKKANYPPVDLKASEKTALETFHVLYDSFLSALFSAQDPSSVIGRVNTLVTFFQEFQGDDVAQLDFLRKFYSETEKGFAALGKPGSTWMDGEFFNPGGSFTELLSLITDLFGQGTVQELAQKTARDFKELHTALLSINSLLVLDPHKVEGNTTIDSGSSVLGAAGLNIPIPAGGEGPSSTAYSQGLFLLVQSLRSCFVHQFLAPVQMRELVPNIPADKVLFWDTKLIHAARDLSKKFEAFSATDLPKLPPALGGIIQKLARRNLRAHLVSLVARAEGLIDAPKDVSESVSAEQILRSKVANTREVAPIFISLLEEINKGNFGTTFVELRTLLGEAAYKSLSRAETILRAHAFYQPRGGKFDWWDGSRGVTFDAFSVNDDTDLQSYLAQQRQQVRQFALEIVAPLVDFLSADIMKDFEGNKNLLHRWQRLIQQLELYDKKQPDNSLSDLENFISKEMGTLELKNCFEKIPLSEVQTTSGDYFFDLKLKLRRGLLAQCEVLKRQKAISQYNQLVQLFRQSIGGKFPFVASKAPQTEGEANPQDLKDFFALYKDAGDSPENILDQVHQLKGTSKEALRFLKQMEEIKKFLGDYLKKDGTDGPSFDFAVDFRLNRAKEKGANMIIDWTFKPDEATTITSKDKTKTGKWKYGDPVTFTFRWPEGIPDEPFAPRGSKVVSVSGRTASYTFSGRWSLLTLLRSQEAPKRDIDTSQPITPYLLKFVVATSPSEKATMYNLLTLNEPPKDDKTPPKPMLVPAFPIQAPDLGDDVLDVADRPVIVEGKNKFKIAESEETAEDSPKKSKKVPKKVEKKGAAPFTPKPLPGEEEKDAKNSDESDEKSGEEDSDEDSDEDKDSDEESDKGEDSDEEEDANSDDDSDEDKDPDSDDDSDKDKGDDEDDGGDDGTDDEDDGADDAEGDPDDNTGGEDDEASDEDEDDKNEGDADDKADDKKEIPKKPSKASPDKSPKQSSNASASASSDDSFAPAPQQQSGGGLGGAANQAFNEATGKLLGGGGGGGAAQKGKQRPAKKGAPKGAQKRPASPGGRKPKTAKDIAAGNALEG